VAHWTQLATSHVSEHTLNVCAWYRIVLSSGSCIVRPVQVIVN